jgi:hypothetical protein
MSGWSLQSIPWGRFDRSRLTPTTIALAKAAALVEYNSYDYGRYLREVFSSEPSFCDAITRWAAEEVQHGEALRRWCEIADPAYDFEAAFAAFSSRIQLPREVEGSVRGSRPGELLARCVVECGTSLYYSSLRDEVAEPVLRAITARIAADEFHHYRLFLSWNRVWQEREPLSALGRIKVLASRMIESGDDELAFAWHCSTAPDQPFHRRRAFSAYTHASMSVLQAQHVDRSIDLVLRASGLRLGPLRPIALRALQRLVRWRIQRVSTRRMRSTTMRQASSSIAA